MLGTAARQTFLKPISPENPFSGGMFSKFGDVRGLAKGFGETAPTLKNPDVMMAFLPKLEQLIKDKSDLQSAKQGLALEFPDSYKQASEALAKSAGGLSESFLSLQQTFNSQNTNFLSQFGDSLTGLQQPISLTNQNVANLADAANRPINPLNSVGVSASIASGSLNNLSAKIADWQMPTPNVTTYSIGIPTGGNGQPVIGVQPPSKASGGTVLRDGLVYVHAGEDIMPADVTKHYRKPERDSPFRRIAALGFDRKENSPSSFLGLREKNSEDAAPADLTRKYQIPHGVSSFLSFRNSEKADDFQRDSSGAKVSETTKAQHSPKGAGTTIHYAPVFNITSKGENIKQDIAAELRRAQAEFERFVSKTMDRSFDRE